MARDKSLAAEIEAVLAGSDDERVARILCDVWGYQWDGDPDADENVIPDRAGGDYDRPDKETFIAGAVAIRSQIIAPLIAALQGRALEDGAWIGLRDHRAVTLRRMHARAERMMQTAYRAGNSTDGAIYREEVDALTWVLDALAPTTPEGRTDRAG